jgi:hypothetical protein
VNGELVCLTLSVPSLSDMETAFGNLAFDVAPGGVLQVGALQIRAEEAAAGPFGLTSWTFLGETAEKVRFDGRAAPPTYITSEPPEPVLGSHPNGVNLVDHIVMMVPALAASVGGLEEHVAASLRRKGEIRGLQAAFMRAGSTVLEIIGMPALDAPRLWGIAFRVDDIAKCLTSIREHGGEVGDAQPAMQGGRIASSPPEAAFGVNVAFVEPPQDEPDPAG